MGGGVDFRFFKYVYNGDFIKKVSTATCALRDR